MRFSSPERKPLVIKATVPNVTLFHLPNDREEYEVLCFDDPFASVDGDPDEWLIRYQSWENAKNARQLDDL